MRLIDADKIRGCAKYIKINEYFEPYIMVADLIKLVEKQPTAYDIDKVVEKLKKRKQEYLEAFIIHGDNELYGIACGLGDAIDIVERSFNNGLHRYNNI